jgi:hypothetical protein
MGLTPRSRGGRYGLGFLFRLPVYLLPFWFVAADQVLRTEERLDREIYLLGPTFIVIAAGITVALTPPQLDDTEEIKRIRRATQRQTLKRHYITLTLPDVIFLIVGFMATIGLILLWLKAWGDSLDRHLAVWHGLPHAYYYGLALCIVAGMLNELKEWLKL